MTPAALDSATVCPLRSVPAAAATICARCAVLSFPAALYPGLNTKLLGDERANRPVTKVGKPYMVYYEENQKTTTDCLNACCFTTHWSYAVLTPDQVEYLNAVTGLDFTEEEFQEVGERIYNLERAYWNRLMSGAA